MPAIATRTPTDRTYTGLDAAYDHFNNDLFGNELPPCLITMQRNPRALGYFSGQRFAELGTPDTITDEIALNPMYFEADQIDDILSTLVHEMVHLWQHHFGKQVRRCYHDRQWAAKMVDVGLVPSDTGEPGGKQTGQRMDHYIEAGGRFAVSCAAFLARGDLVLFKDRVALAEGGKGGIAGGGDGGDDQEGGDTPAEPIVKLPGRVKFTCPKCGLNAWAKPAARLGCGDCGKALVSEYADGISTPAPVTPAKRAVRAK